MANTSGRTRKGRAARPLRRVAAVAPSIAARLGPADSTRIARALEVVRSTGRPIGEWQAEKVGGIASEVTLNPLILLPPREWLYARCDERFAAMLDGGAQAEVSSLLVRNLDPDLPVMRAIGVREIAALIELKTDLSLTFQAGAQATRRYAKRQYTWFSNQPPREWPRWRDVPDESALATFASLRA